MKKRQMMKDYERMNRMEMIKDLAREYISKGKTRDQYLVAAKKIMRGKY